MVPAGPGTPLTIALLTTDNRWFFKDYDNPVPQFGPAPTALIEGFKDHPEIELHIVSSTKKKVPSPPKLAYNIWFHSQYVPRLGWMRTAFLGCVLATRRTVRSIRPAIVHGQGTESDCALSAVFSGFPNVLTLHGNMRRIARLERHAYNRIAARLEAIAVPRTLGMVCLSTHTERQVKALARRTWVIPNAVDPSFFGLKTGSDKSAPPRILCAATICTLKNQLGLIRALDALASRRKFELIFLGSGAKNDPYCEEFRQAVEQRAWCKHPGFANREMLKQYLQQTTLLALPSFEENCPMVILEAMAAGVPVAAANAGGIPDLVQNGETGFLFDPKDEKNIGSVIESALSDRSRLERVAVTAREKARARFHPQVVAEQHLGIYREVLNLSKKDCRSGRDLVKQSALC